MTTRDQIEQLSFTDILQLIKMGERELFLFYQSLSEETVASRVRRLRETVEKIGSTVVRRPPPLERYLLQWQEYVSGKRNHLDPAAARYLCWEPDISMDYQFVTYLEKFPSVLGSRSLIGLVRSCHGRWDSVSPTVMGKVKIFVMKYDGPNKAVQKWRSDPDTVIHQKGPVGLAKHLVTTRLTIDQLVAEWYLEPQSPFLQNVVAVAVALCRETVGMSSYDPRALFEDILPWKGWKTQDRKLEIQQLILHRDVQKVQEALQRFVLAHKDLGDPRLPRNRKNWDAISRDAVNRFVEMLCREDILFFFDYVYSTSSDKHMRKEFWLRYVARCVASRPLLTPSDKVRLKSVIGTRIGQPGEIRSATNSAFMLDFGEITAVEFSRIGACYIYESRAFKEVVPDFWSSRAFTEANLKDRHLCLNRIRHLNTHNIDWRAEVRNILAQWGIRPGGTI
jgi:hypothetical protein